MTPEEPNPQTVVWVLGGCLFFVVASIAIPAGYHFFQPSPYYMSVEDVQVQIQEDDPCTHKLTTVYWSRHSRIVDTNTRLYLVRTANGGPDAPEGGKEVNRWQGETHLSSGINNHEVKLEMDEPLKEGVYQYKFDINYNVRYGWNKHHDVKSVKFAVYHGDTKPPWAYGTDNSFNYSSTARCA